MQSSTTSLATIVGALAALGVMLCDDDFHAMVGGALLQPVELRLAVFGAVVDRDQAGEAEDVAHVVDVAIEVRDARLERFQVLLPEIGHFDAAVVLDRPHRCDDHRGIRPEAALAALDVHELLGAEVRAEAGLGHDVIRELERGARRHYRIAAVRDVGERSAVDEGGIVLERLYQVRRERIFQNGRHRAMRPDVAGEDRLVVARVADDDFVRVFSFRSLRLVARQKIAITSEATTMSKPSWRG